MPSQCHEIDYQIMGDDLQMVVVELDPGESVIAEAGPMTFIQDGIEFEAKMGDGSQPQQGFFAKLMQAGKRASERSPVSHFS